MKNIMKEIITNVEKDGIKVTYQLEDIQHLMGPQFRSTINGLFSQPGFTPALVETVSLNPVKLNLVQPNAYELSILLHEIAHATGTEDRLNRQGITFTGLAKRGRVGQLATILVTFDKIIIAQNVEEIIAESVAYKILNMLGLHNSNLRLHQEAYIEFHKKGLTEFHLAQVDREVNKAIDYIFKNWLTNDIKQTTKAA